jgi:hypothetical protein
MTKDQKRKVLRSLGTSYGKGTDLAALLWLQEKADEARSVESRNAKLRKAIDALRRELWTNWSGTAAALQTRIRSVNRRLQARIRKLEGGVRAAGALVEALGLLDEAIQISVRLRS